MRTLTAFLTLLLCTGLAAAERYTDQELQLVGFVKNAALSSFLDKQQFPEQLTREVAEALGLSRDVDKYGEKGNACKQPGFYFADFAHWFGDPLLMRTIAPAHRSESMSKAEYQGEWNKVFAKFGKPREMEVSRQIWPFDKSGMIEYANYYVNWRQKPVLVAFYLTSVGCLHSTVFYKEQGLRESVDKAIEKQRERATRRDVLSDSLK